MGIIIVDTETGRVYEMTRFGSFRDGDFVFAVDEDDKPHITQVCGDASENEGSFILSPFGVAGLRGFSDDDIANELLRRRGGGLGL